MTVKLEKATVTLSVEGICKFCGWKKVNKKQHPLFLCAKDGKVTAFCPMCEFELNIFSQEIEEAENEQERK